MFGATTSQVPDEIPSDDEPGQPDDAPRRNIIATKIDQLRPPVPLIISSQPDSPPQREHPILQREHPILQREQAPQPAPSLPIPSPPSPLLSPQFEQREDTSVDFKTETPQPEAIPSSHQRPSRQRQQPNRLTYHVLGGLANTDSSSSSSSSNVSEVHFAASLSSWGSTYQARVDPLHDTDLGCVGNLSELPVHLYNYCFLSAKKKNPDLFTYDEVMSDHRRLDEWKASALKEITQFEAKEVWDECFKSESLDKKEKIIPCTWVYRIKRTPDVEFSKCKSLNRDFSTTLEFCPHII
jgi:hypothetical protein